VNGAMVMVVRPVSGMRRPVVGIIMCVVRVVVLGGGCRLSIRLCYVTVVLQLCYEVGFCAGTCILIASSCS
jgi:hypothetical protein